MQKVVLNISSNELSLLCEAIDYYCNLMYDAFGENSKELLEAENLQMKLIDTYKR